MRNSLVEPLRASIAESSDGWTPVDRRPAGAARQRELDPADILGGRIFPPLFFMPPPLVITAAMLVVTALALVCTIWRHALADLAGMSEHDFVIHLLQLASIPLVSLVFTYVHIYLALFLTFYPVTYMGCLQVPGTNLGLGWQGIVPFKATHFAKRSCHLMTSKLISVDEMLLKLDPVQI